MSLLVDDRALLDAYRRGEKAALEAVFRHYAPHVSLMLRHGFSFAAAGKTVRFQGYRRVFDIEDLMQDIFRRTFSDNARNTYDGLRPFKTWITTITRNVVINDYQAKKRILARYSLENAPEAAQDDNWSASHDPLSAEPSATGNPHHDAESKELRELVQAYKKTLNERESEVFHWRFEAGLAHIEVSERTGLSSSRIKTSEARIRQGLLRFMKQHGYLLNSRRRTTTSVAPQEAPQGGDL